MKNGSTAVTATEADAAATTLELPLFARYHALLQSPNVRNRLTKKFPHTSLDFEEDRMVITVPTTATATVDLQSIANLLRGIIAKQVDANYFIGARPEGIAFNTAAAASVESTLHLFDEPDRKVLQDHIVAAQRFSMCLFPLKIYSPRALFAVQGVLQASFTDDIPTEVEFAPQLQASGPCKLATFASDGSKKSIMLFSNRLRSLVEKALEGVPEASVNACTNPHISLLKITWPMGSKKAKLAAQQVAGRVKLHKLDPSSLPFTSGDSKLVKAGLSSVHLFQIDGPHPPLNADGEYHYISHGSLAPSAENPATPPV